MLDTRAAHGILEAVVKEKWKLREAFQGNVISRCITLPVFEYK